MRDTARAPQPPINQPIGHQMSRPGLYVPKKAYFGAKMAGFGSIILSILRGSKSSSTHQKVTYAPRSILSFGRAWHQIDEKGQYLAKNDQICIFWAEFGRFAAKILISWRGSKSLGTQISENLLPPHCHCLLVGHSTTMDQNDQHLAKFGHFWAKKLIFKGGRKTFGTLISGNLQGGFLTALY